MRPSFWNHLILGTFLVARLVVFILCPLFGGISGTLELEWQVFSLRVTIGTGQCKFFIFCFPELFNRPSSGWVGCGSGWTARTTPPGSGEKYLFRCTMVENFLREHRRQKLTNVVETLLEMQWMGWKHEVAEIVRTSLIAILRGPLASQSNCTFVTLFYLRFWPLT